MNLHVSVFNVFTLHVHYTVSHVRVSYVNNQRLYMLCQLKRQGLPLNCLNLVFDSLIVSRLMYATMLLLLGLVT